ncbi:RlmE family RNA methyltransferase [Rickettsiales bacterium]|nr:RlmE family RNA methyltransferase [Rickettsiales bacterium]
MKQHTIKKPKKTQNPNKVAEKIKSIESTRSTTQKVKTSKDRTVAATNWIRRHINDPFVQQAKADGMLSRAVYKLMEIDGKFGILKPEQKVVDIGAAPGSWMKFVWEKTRSKNSLLIGIDLIDIDFKPDENDKLAPNVHYIQGDFNSPEIQQELQDKMDGMADVMISDIAPNTIGSSDIDHIRSMSLINEAIRFTLNNLREGGDFICKMFNGSETEETLKLLKRSFKHVKMFKPKSSRKESNEVYAVCRDRKRNESVKEN